MRDQRQETRDQKDWRDQKPEIQDQRPEKLLCQVKLLKTTGYFNNVGSFAWNNWTWNLEM
jgi:hypothetical protein